jgi:hypothetical protein
LARDWLCDGARLSAICWICPVTFIVKFLYLLKNLGVHVEVLRLRLLLTSIERLEGFFVEFVVNVIVVSQVRE